MKPGQRLEWDWHDGHVPRNASVHPTAYIETTLTFGRFRSTKPNGLVYGRGAATYKGTTFDVGRHGSVTLGDFSLVHGARIICDGHLEIGAYALISWDVVIMDTYRIPEQISQRRQKLNELPPNHRKLSRDVAPVKICDNVWIGFGSCVLPGVTVGEGTVVGARSVVYESVPPFCIVAGNPARVIREFEEGQKVHAPS